MTIITTDFSKITLNQKLLEVSTPKGDIALDLHFLFNQDNYGELAYFNATEIAKMFNKRYEQVTRGENWKDYIALVQENLNTQICVIRKSERRFFTAANNPRAIVSLKGRYGGTWLHQDLAIEFMGLLSVEWKYAFHQFFKKLVRHTEKMVLDRKETKILFHPLANTIKERWIPNQSQNGGRWAYQNILDLCNRHGVGKTARQYRIAHGITIEQIKKDGNTSIRDYMTANDLDKIKKVEEIAHGLIRYGKIYNFNELGIEIKKELER